MLIAREATHPSVKKNKDVATAGLAPHPQTRASEEMYRYISAESHRAAEKRRVCCRHACANSLTLHCESDTLWPMRLEPHRRC